MQIKTLVIEFFNEMNRIVSCYHMRNKASAIESFNKMIKISSELSYAD